MTCHYEAFGLAIRSDQPLPGLRPSEVQRVGLTVEFADSRAPEVDPGATATTAATGSGSVRACEDGGCVLRYASHGGESLLSTRVSGDGRSIEVRWRGSVALADIAAFVETTAIPTALALRGVPMLHGCAVDIGDAAFLVVGAGGAGKSTVAAAALARGNALLTDDIAALDTARARVHVHPGGCRLRMNGDTARALGWDGAGLERVFVNPALPRKTFLPLSTADGTLCAEARRVAAIFVLEERRAGSVRIGRVAPMDAVGLLLRNTFGQRAVDARVRAQLLPFWTRLAREVPVHTVSRPDDLAAAPELVDALGATVRRCPPASASPQAPALSSRS